MNNWEEGEGLVPGRAVVPKLLRIGKLPVSIAGGVNYWAESPAGGPEGWGGGSPSPCCSRGEDWARR